MVDAGGRLDGGVMGAVTGGSGSELWYWRYLLVCGSGMVDTGGGGGMILV